MCTGIRLIAGNGASLYARTLEFAQRVDSNIVVIPRGYSFTGTDPQGKAAGKKWRTTYAVVGANAMDIIGVIDGVNEVGLAGGLFYFPDYAQFQDVPVGQYEQSIACWELLTWILTQFSTVEQVRQALPTIKVSNVPFGPWGFTPPVHAIVHDPSGASLVIEYVQGMLFMYDNPLGVVTNSPTFDWHSTNLKNYAGLTPYNIAPLTVKGVTLNPLGQGSGMRGLPGDFTSPSRFIQAAALSQTAVDINDESDALESAFHILNHFDIPFGSVRQEEQEHTACEYTQWTSACDLRNKRYYWHTYANRNIQMVDLMTTDLNAQKPLVIVMAIQEDIRDVTPRNGK